jgi:hypothetical protein
MLAYVGNRYRTCSDHVRRGGGLPGEGGNEEEESGTGGFCGRAHHTGYTCVSQIEPSPGAWKLCT